MPDTEPEIHKIPDIIPPVDVAVSEKKPKVDTSMLSSCAKAVVEEIERLSMSEFTVDDIIEAGGFNTEEVLGAVTELEIFGVLKAVPGGRFSLD